jgi:hypothetical protein
MEEDEAIVELYNSIDYSLSYLNKWYNSVVMQWSRVKIHDLEGTVATPPSRISREFNTEKYIVTSR